MTQSITERQKSILDALIREYVIKAEPVASSEIVRRYRLPYSPATVRNELQALDEAGFLAQPHTSAGRVPTDKGYRFFVRHLAQDESDVVGNREEMVLRGLMDLDDPAEFIKQSSRALAHLTKNVVLAGFPEEDIFYKSGMGEVMREPEFSDMELMRGFSVLMDEIEDEVLNWFDRREHPGDDGEIDEPQTFIGSENPIRIARHYGMIVYSYETPFGKESVIALVGPKRMDYGHNIALLKRLQEILLC